MTQTEIWSERYAGLVKDAKPLHVALFVALQGRVGELPDGTMAVEELEKHGFKRGDAIEFLKELESVGLGKFLAGRRQQVSRFKWNVSAKTFAREFIARHQRASNGEDTLRTSELHTHRFLVRPGIEVEFQLPLNFSPDEANRLADFIKTLPF